MIRFYVIPRDTIRRVTASTPIPSDFLAEWELSRPGVLNDETQDIFAPNCRSEKQEWKDFSLFEQVADPSDADVVVCQHWLEISEATGVPENIWKIIQFALMEYPGKLLFTWNHDRDAATVAELRKLPSRCIVLQYNTSSPMPNDLLVPFWTLRTNWPIRQKRWKAGFLGYDGTQLRYNLQQAVQGKPGYYWSSGRLGEEQYMDMTASFTFSLCPRGGGLNSWRFYESIQCGSIPVLFADAAKLPDEFGIDWEKTIVRLPERMVNDFAGIDGVLDTVNVKELEEAVLSAREKLSLLGVQRVVHSRIKELEK